MGDFDLEDVAAFDAVALAGKLALGLAATPRFAPTVCWSQPAVQKATTPTATSCTTTADCAARRKVRVAFVNLHSLRPICHSIQETTGLSQSTPNNLQTPIGDVAGTLADDVVQSQSFTLGALAAAKAQTHDRAQHQQHR